MSTSRAPPRGRWRRRRESRPAHRLAHPRDQAVAMPMSRTRAGAPVPSITSPLRSPGPGPPSLPSAKRVGLSDMPRPQGGCYSAGPAVRAAWDRPGAGPGRSAMEAHGSATTGRGAFGGRRRPREPPGACLRTFSRDAARSAGQLSGVLAAITGAPLAIGAELLGVTHAPAPTIKGAGGASPRSSGGDPLAAARPAALAPGRLDALGGRSNGRSRGRTASSAATRCPSPCPCSMASRCRSGPRSRRWRSVPMRSAHGRRRAEMRRRVVAPWAGTSGCCAGPAPARARWRSPPADGGGRGRAGPGVPAGRGAERASRTRSTAS